MIDARLDRLSELIVRYSLDLAEGEIVRIDGSVAVTPLIVGLYAAALRRGANAYTNVGLDSLAELLLEEGSEAQLRYVPAGATREIETVDAIVTVWGDENTRELGAVSAARHRVLLESRRELRKRRLQRIGTGELRWCGTLFPGTAHAQDAGMSLADYEDFVFRACHVDTDDAESHWQRLADALRRRARQLATVRELRVLGRDTDLRLRVDGRTWAAADGHLNMPDGEVYTAPLETATAGDVRFELPAIYDGHEVEAVRLRFSGGEVVAAEAGRGADYLQSVLELPGARVLGEVAFGLNYEIDRFTRNILFDEKIGGTMHVALGDSVPLAGGSNESSLHLDLICDLRSEGEVYADGELIWRAGRFLDDREVGESG